MKGNEFEHFLGNLSLSTLLAKASFAFLLLSMLFYWFQTTFNTDKKAFLGKVPALTMWLANITLAIMLFLRWGESGHFPLSNLYESLLFLSWSLTSIHLFLESVINSKSIVSPILNLGSITSPLALFTNAFATFSLPQEMQKVTVLVPALQSNWLIMHVSVMMASYAALLSGSLLAMAFLVVKFFDDYGVIYSDEKDYLLRKPTSAAASQSNKASSLASQTYAVPCTKVNSKQLPSLSKQQKDKQVPPLKNSTVNFSGREQNSDQLLQHQPCHPCPKEEVGKADSPNFLGFSWFNLPKVMSVLHQTLLKSTKNQNNDSFASSKEGIDKAQTLRLSTLPALPPSDGWVDTECQPATPFGGSSKGWSINKVNYAVNHEVERPNTLVNSKPTFIKQSSSEMNAAYIENAEESINLAQILDNLSYRSIGLGFALLTIGIFSGAVWANEAWGSYWSWDPKETWALVTWLVFAMYLHTRLSQGWVGKESAFVATFGFLVLWFCYLGVNLFGKGLHSYGWFPDN